MFTQTLRIVALISLGSILVLGQNTDECKSSTCVQQRLYRDFKSLFDKDAIPIFGGLTFVKDPASRREDRSLSETAYEKAQTTEAKEDALEDYVVDKFVTTVRDGRFVLELGSVSDSVRSLSEYVPQSVKEGVSSLMTEEGRGKKKKLKKLLLPLLMILKLKMGLFGVLAFLGIGLIALKALGVGSLALLISGFLAIKKLLSQKGHHEVHHDTPVHHGHGYSSGWDSYDPHGAYSNNVAHTLAYNGQKPVSR